MISRLHPDLAQESRQVSAPPRRSERVRGNETPPIKYFGRKSRKCREASFNVAWTNAQETLRPEKDDARDSSIVNLMERKGFKIFGSDSWSDDKELVIILLEFSVWKLPEIKKAFRTPIMV